eukprot:scaffold91857_cov20-Tisochrysis_lutea.AAC.1
MQDRALLCKSTSNSLAAPFMQPPCCASTAPASHQYSYNFPMNQVGTRHQSKDFSHNLSLQTATESFTRRQSKLSHRLMGLRGFGAIGDVCMGTCTNFYVHMCHWMCGAIDPLCKDLSSTCSCLCFAFRTIMSTPVVLRCVTLALKTLKLFLQGPMTYAVANAYVDSMPLHTVHDPALPRV